MVDRLTTLGCKVNQYETELVRQGLVDNGFRDAKDGEAAQLCIVNTCTVTRKADAAARQFIRRVRRKHPRIEVIAVGCSAAIRAADYEQMPQVGPDPEYGSG